MIRTLSSAAAMVVLALSTAHPTLARDSGGRGGDREPAGGAFMTSYPEQGSTGIQRGGPPRSVDIPYNSERVQRSARPDYGELYPYR